MTLSLLRRPVVVAVIFLAITCALTWPLVTVIDRELAPDLGDPMLSCWIILWTGGQVLAFLSGDFGALSRYWNGNIYYPEPLTLAYAEHLTAEMVQALPILALTDNIILAHNLVFISTFVLSGLGMYLLVRDLTGRSMAALIAGLAFAFAPYRIGQLSHIQVLSAQWMPFVLFGFRRYLDRGNKWALVGGAAALVAQNLSCGYYMLFFTPFAAAYVVYELVARGRLRDWAAWRAFVAAGIGVVAATLPFLIPYLKVRGHGLGVRSLGEIMMFSADVHAFASAPINLWLWGERLTGFHRGEGQAFPGFTILLLALVGIGAGWLTRTRRLHQPLPAWRQVTAGFVSMMLAAFLYALGSVLVVGQVKVPTNRGWMVWHYVGPMILVIAALSLALVLMRWRTQRTSRPGQGLPWAFFAIAALVAAVLALGPRITVNGAVVASGPYAWLMDYVPGFDGLRVPARFVIIVTLFLATLAGLGASFIQARAGRLGAGFLVLAGALILLESWPAAFHTNLRPEAEGFELTPRDLHVGRDLPPIYKTIRDSPDSVVLVEFPFGTLPWDMYSMFYAGYHRQHLVNGYSGFFPESNTNLRDALNLRIRDPQLAWRALQAVGTTHVLVHESAFPEERRQEVSSWLRASGAKELLVDGSDRLFAVR